MKTLTQKSLTLQDFLSLPDEDITHELIEGKAVPKMLPKRFHSRLTLALSFLLDEWNQTQDNQGEVGIEWAITLQRNGKDWCPVHDLLYISYERLTGNADKGRGHSCRGQKANIFLHPFSLLGV